MGSQALEVGIGLVLAFLLLSTVSSAVVEFIGVLLQKRSRDLEAVINKMLSTGDLPPELDLYATSIFKSLQGASRRKRGVVLTDANDGRQPSYVSARSFADAVLERLMKIKAGLASGQQLVDAIPQGPLRDRLLALAAETNGDLTQLKAGLESWFDDTMDRLQGAYRRWSQWLLLLVGFVLAAALNVSTVRIVDSLWNDSTIRAAVADAAEGYAQQQPTTDDTPPNFATIEEAIDDLTDLQLPVGWGPGWDAETGAVPTVLGLPLTALAVMLGAPFWFDVLTKLIVARKARGEPPRASEDPGSSTTMVNQTAPTVAAAAPSAPAATPQDLLHAAVP